MRPQIVQKLQIVKEVCKDKFKKDVEAKVVQAEKNLVKA